MKSLTLLSMIILSSCYHDPNDPRTIRGVDPEFNYYIDLYVKIKGEQLYYDIPIQFSSNMPLGEIGNCRRWSYKNYRQITIDKAYWLRADTNRRVSLIFHELGHCDLNRDHLKTLDYYGMPTSLMYPYNIGFNYEDESYYFNELFSSYRVGPSIAL